MLKPHFLVIVLSAAILAPLASAKDAPPTPKATVLWSVQVDVQQPPAIGTQTAPVRMPRHFANPALIGRVKASLAASGKSPGPSKRGTPTPKPSRSPSPTPSASPSPTPAPISSGVTNPLSTTQNFPALGFLNGGGYVPPDTTVAAGNVNGTTELLEAVNVAGEVYSTSTPSQGIASLNTAACTPNPSSDSVSDPRVLFDTASGRWFISTTTFFPISDAGWGLLVSPGSDPTVSTWGCLFISTSGIKNPDGSTGNFPDFPKIGINGNKVVLTGDAYSATQTGFQTQYKFQGTEFIVINKSELLGPSGTGIYTYLFPPSQGDVAIEPAQQLGLPLNPTTYTDNLYMAAVNSNVSSTSTMDVWTVTGVPTASATPSVTKTSLPISTISIPPNAQQEGTTVLIDTNDDSLLDAVFRDGSPGSLWVSGNTACTPPGDSSVRSCLRFMEVSIASGTMQVVQDFNYADKDVYYYYPAIRTNKFGDLVAVFSGSSTTSYASVYAGMQLAGNTNTNVFTNLSQIYAGDSPYTVSPPRWGDYSGAGVDPNDTNIWIAGEYATTEVIFGSVWGTAIAEVQP